MVSTHICVVFFLTSLQFHKRQEKDLLDQKKETEETLLLEMVSVTLHLPSAGNTSVLL